MDLIGCAISKRRGGDLARAFALKLTQQWLKRYARYTPETWRPETIAERFLNLFAHGRFFLTDCDLVWRSKLFVSLRQQAQMLSRTVDEAPDGLPRLKSAAAFALAGFCLGDARQTALGMKRLGLEIDRQILPDGGHIGRSPQTLLEAYRVLGMVQETLESGGGRQPIRACAARSTESRPCCDSSAWEMARWRSSMVGARAIRAPWKQPSTATTHWDGLWVMHPIRDISALPPRAHWFCSTPARRPQERFRRPPMPDALPLK